jgi:deoxyribonuclease-4
LRIGLHARNQGSLEKTARHARELGANTLQIFTSSPRMWKASRPDPRDAAALRRVREQLDLTPLAVHDNYLINLASANPAVRQPSILAFRGELERARLIGADYLVAHPGSAKGQPAEQAMANFVTALAEAGQGFSAPDLMLLLECTAGSGQALGARLEELHALREVGQNVVDFPIGFCLDTCHLHAAGYDLASASGLARTAREIGRVLGWPHVRLCHVNDSQGALGSRVDRHANIGKGQIGADGFGRLARHSQFRRLAWILETPMDTDEDARRDLDTLKSLCQRRRTITPPSK